jgi:outer membrane protein assembly factor BamB
MSKGIFVRGIFSLLVRDEAFGSDGQLLSDEQTGPYHLLAFSLGSGQRLAEHRLSTNNWVGVTGADDERAYLIGGPGNDINVLYGLNLSNGAFLWRYQVDNEDGASRDVPLMAL